MRGMPVTPPVRKRDGISAAGEATMPKFTGSGRERGCDRSSIGEKVVPH